MSNFPIDVAAVRELRDTTVRQYLLQSLWGTFIPNLIPWRLRVALWNATWGLPKEQQLNWRTRTIYGKAVQA